MEAALLEAEKPKSNSARRFLLEVIRLTQGGDPQDESAPTDFETLSPAKRAALRAELDEFLAAQDKDAANEQDA
jgi:hypothetical protein